MVCRKKFCNIYRGHWPLLMSVTRICNNYKTAPWLSDHHGGDKHSALSISIAQLHIMIKNIFLKPSSLLHKTPSKWSHFRYVSRLCYQSYACYKVPWLIPYCTVEKSTPQTLWAPITRGFQAHSSFPHCGVELVTPWWAYYPSRLRDCWTWTRCRWTDPWIPHWKHCVKDY